MPYAQSLVSGTTRDAKTGRLSLTIESLATVSVRQGRP